MATNPSAPSCYNLEQGSISIRTKIQNEQENKARRLKHFIRPILAELIGTTCFILIGLFGACNDQSETNSLTAAFSFGLAVMILIASIGQISGGHFNPVVTIGILIAKGIAWKKALVYILMQVIGGIMAAGIFRLFSHANTYQQCHGGTTSLAAMKIHWWEGLFIELLFTFIFVTVILMVAIENKSKSDFAPIYIGLALCVCILASNMLTGGSLNPARSLGPAIFANVWSYHYIYWLGPLIGGILAGGFYRFIWSSSSHDQH